MNRLVARWLTASTIVSTSPSSSHGKTVVISLVLFAKAPTAALIKPRTVSASPAGIMAQPSETMITPKVRDALADQLSFNAQAALSKRPRMSVFNECSDDEPTSLHMLY